MLVLYIFKQALTREARRNLIEMRKQVGRGTPDTTHNLKVWPDVRKGLGPKTDN